MRIDNTPTMVDVDDFNLQAEEPSPPQGDKEKLIDHCDRIKFTLLRCTKKLTDNPHSSLVEIQQCNDVAQSYDHCAREIRTLYEDEDPHISEEDWKKVNEEFEKNGTTSSFAM